MTQQKYFGLSDLVIMANLNYGEKMVNAKRKLFLIVINCNLPFVIKSIYVFNSTNIYRDGARLKEKCVIRTALFVFESNKAN